MKLYTYLDGGTERVAAGVPGTDDKIVDLIAAGGDPSYFASMISLIEAGEPALAAARAICAASPASAIRHLADVTLASPIPRPPKLRGHSVFERHLRQSAVGAVRRMTAAAPDPEAAFQKQLVAMGLDKLPGPGWYKVPGYYLMDVDCVTGSGSTVKWPGYSQWIDYELEIAAVIGRGGRDISLADANRHIFGYTIINDLSARDTQLEYMATSLGAGKGKDFDNSNVVGPCIVTTDEIADPYAMHVRVLVNGEEWSATDGQEAQFKFDKCIEQASRGQTVRSGEMFSTGTWPGCSSLELVRTVERGAVIEFVVDRIGTLRATVA